MTMTHPKSILIESMDAARAMRRTFRAQWIVVIGCLCLIAGLLIYQQSATRSATDRLEQIHLHNLTQIAANILQRRLTETDALLSMLEGEFFTSVGDQDTKTHLSQEMEKMAGLGYGTSILMLLDAHGNVLSANQKSLIGENFSHRHYFRGALAAVDGKKRIISPPFQTVLGDYTFTLSRKLFDQQGRFVGVLMATLDTPFIAQLLATTLYAPDMWTALVHGNGVQVLSVPAQAHAAGRILNQPGSYFTQHLSDPQNASPVLDSTLGFADPQMVAVLTVQPVELNMDQPLIVAIGRDTTALLADWREQSTLLLALYFFIATLSVIGLRLFQKREISNWKAVARQQALAQASSDGLHMLDMEGRLIDANPAFFNMLGLDRSAIGQIKIDSFDSAQPPQQIIENMRRLKESGEKRVLETRHRRQDGVEIDVEINCQCFESDGETFLIASSRDITGRKQIESRIHQLSLAVEQSPESICITDAEARIEFVNAALIESSGYSWEELHGQNPRLLSSGETPSETYQAMWSALANGETWRGEFINRRKNGEIYIESEIISPIRQADGRITHYLATKQEITEKKRIEAELHTYRTQLEAKVAARTAELTSTNQALDLARHTAEAATRTKAAFLANMSHEIRTPMNGIIGMLYVLRRSGVTPKQNEFLDKIALSAEHLLTLINDILDISKIDAGKLKIEAVPIAVEQIILNIASIISTQTQPKGLQIDIQTAPLPSCLLGDSTRLTQALLNFASNAVKFTDHGRITLRTMVEKESDSDACLRFEVEDSGIGIAPETLSRLFSPFEQADQATTRLYGGTGLGLTITRNLARLMGGEAGAQSTLGEGSLFWFTVRLNKCPPTNLEQDHHPRGQAEELLRSRFGGTRVLVVEDEPINQEIAALLLQEAGIVAEIAENGEVAIAKLAQADYALILMDMQMPVMDGLEASRQIRQLPKSRHIPIVAMTANAFADDRERCITAGMDDFISKPADPERLFRILLHWLERGQHN